MHFLQDYIRGMSPVHLFPIIVFIVVAFLWFGARVSIRTVKKEARKRGVKPTQVSKDYAMMRLFGMLMFVVMIAVFAWNCMVNGDLMFMVGAVMFGLVLLPPVFALTAVSDSFVPTGRDGWPLNGYATNYDCHLDPGRYPGIRPEAAKRYFVNPRTGEVFFSRDPDCGCPATSTAPCPPMRYANASRSNGIRSIPDSSTDRNRLRAKK